MRRQPAFLAIAAVCALALGALPGAFAGSTADPGITSTSIVLGGTSPLTGPAAAYASVARGAKAYLDSVNAKGGVAKRKFEYKIVDDAYNPAQSVQATRQLVEQDKVFAVFNSLGTEQNIAVREYLNQTKVPQLFVASGATTWGRDAAKYPWTIGFQPSYQAEGWVYGQYVAKTMKKAKIAVLLQNDDYGKDLLAGLKRGLAPLGLEGRRRRVVRGDRTRRPVADREAQVLRRERLRDLRDAEVRDPGVRLREPARLEAADDQQLRLRRLEHHAARLRGREEQVDRGRDLAQLPQGPDRPEVEERPGDEDLPLGHGEVREGRERERRLPRVRHGGRVRDCLALQAPGREPDPRGPDGARALDHEPGEPVPASRASRSGRARATTSRSSRASSSAGRRASGCRSAGSGSRTGSRHAARKVRTRQSATPRPRLPGSAAPCRRAPAPLRGSRTRRRRSRRRPPSSPQTGRR